MCFRIVLLALCLAILPLFAAEQCSSAPPPSWVKFYDFPLDPLPVKASEVNLQCLLLEKQRNWEEKSSYYHDAIRILTQNGTESLSQLTVDYNPAFTKLQMHLIRVYRDGKWSDRLEKARCNVVQRETRLDDNLYDGSLTAVYFIEDLREGDILEFAYTLAGENPFYDSHLTEFAELQKGFAVEKLQYRLLANPDVAFEIRNVNTSVEPAVTDLSPTLREWEWIIDQPAVYKYEKYQPVWHNLPPHFELSAYKTWAEVAQEIYNFFQLPADFDTAIPPEMEALVISWMEATPSPHERAIYAIRFVQDEVRYLGIEESSGAYTPADPRITFQRRFGDCKDKTLLLHALLYLMDIDSTPLLVHSSHGQILADRLPIPRLFNHAILEVTIDEIPYYIDSTITLQGGSLDTNHVPNYHYGLLIADTTTDLIPLPEATLPMPTEIDSFITFESENQALMTTTTTFYGLKADRWRRTLNQAGLARTSENLIQDLQKIYGEVEVETPLKLIDNRETNSLTTTITYRIPVEDLSDRTYFELYSYAIRSSLDTSLNPTRTAPYELNYPLWIKERIRIENRFHEWAPLEEETQKAHPSLYYAQAAHVSGHSAEFEIELKHLQDHVTLGALKEYWKLVKQIKNWALPPLSIKED